MLNKIKLIIAREYLTRVKKTSFIVMTFLGPILMAALMLVPIWLAIKDKDIQLIEVIDGTDPNDPCDFLTANITLATTGWDAADCDGDGVTNGQEVIDGTDPTDPCDYRTAQAKQIFFFQLINLLCINNHKQTK